VGESIETFDNWSRTIHESGLLLSPGKNYISRDFLMLNSRAIVRSKSGLKLVNGVFLPVLCNFKDSYRKPVIQHGVPTYRHHAVLERPISNSGEEMRSVIKTNDTKVYERYLNTYLKHREIIGTWRNSPICPFLPATAGGLGGPLPPVAKIDIARRVALGIQPGPDTKCVKIGLNVPRKHRAVSTAFLGGGIDAPGPTEIDVSFCKQIKRPSYINKVLSASYPPPIVKALLPKYKLCQSRVVYTSSKRMVDRLINIGKTLEGTSISASNVSPISEINSFMEEYNARFNLSYRSEFSRAVSGSVTPLPLVRLDERILIAAPEEEEVTVNLPNFVNGKSRLHPSLSRTGDVRNFVDLY